ncbi:MAG: Hsp70 family protein [Polyangiaceae bacterium]
MKPTVYAIDFGTSNSLLAAASPTEVFDPIPLDPDASDPTLLRTALYFVSLDEGQFGVAAIRALVENGFRGRLIRSIKRHLPSRVFVKTRIGYRNAALEDLIGRFLRVMRERANAHFGVDVRTVVMGRPARFSNVEEDDALAETRLERAARSAGFEAISFCPEPVAAAYDFAEDLAAPRVVMVADLGGGTSDFTVVRMGREGFRKEDVLAVGGVAVAGDAIDGALVRGAAAPHFGSKARYRVPFGANDLDMPMPLVEILCSPADLTILDRDKIAGQLQDIRAGLVSAADRPALDRFIALVEDGLGFTLYEAVEGAKRRLSSEDKTMLDVTEPSLAFREETSRALLDRVATPSVGAIVGAMDKTLTEAGIAGSDVELLCLTGGTAQMPLVARAIQDRLPNAGLRRLKSFHSVVRGLAHRAREVAST